MVAQRRWFGGNSYFLSVLINISLLTKASPNKHMFWVVFFFFLKGASLLSQHPPFISKSLYLEIPRPKLHCSHTWEKNPPSGTVLLDKGWMSEGFEQARQNVMLWVRALERECLSLDPGFVKTINYILIFLVCFSEFCRWWWCWQK